MNDNSYDKHIKDYSEIVDKPLHLKKQITNLINSFEYLYCYETFDDTKESCNKHLFLCLPCFGSCVNSSKTYDSISWFPDW